MQEKPKLNKNFPPRMRRRIQRSGRAYYYYDTGGKPRREIPLGPDYVTAVQKWAELEVDHSEALPVLTFKGAALRYIREVLPTKAPRTQSDNLKELEVLYEFFDNPPAALSFIEPQHIRQYRFWRMERTKQWYLEQGRDAPTNAGGVRANRELALFSHIFNYAREIGLTSVADILALSEKDIQDGSLEVQQGKTRKKLRISIEGQLATVLKRIKARKSNYNIASPKLIVNEKGQPLGRDALRSRFDKAREIAEIKKHLFQFRDLRAKAGTDKADSTGDIRQAQRQLRHKCGAKEKGLHCCKP